MANILLGVTGSVAAVRTPMLYGLLQKAGHRVRIVATRASLYFFEPAAFEPVDSSRPERNPAVVSVDEDEWPGLGAGERYRRDQSVLHIELRRWAELFLVAPLDANTLAKLANGIADNCLTCVWRAWDPEGPAVLAPAMNTLMWDHPLTRSHFRQLAELTASEPVPTNLDIDALLEWINITVPKLHVIPPVTKRLACGDIGMGALAELEDIVTAVKALAP